MKRALLWGLTLVAAFAVTGCPVYPDDNHACLSSADCAPGYACDFDSGFCHLSPGSGASACSDPSECGVNETCGRDGRCHIGSCRIETTGCVDGFSCVVADGAWTCVAGADGGGGSSGGGAGAPGAAGAAGAAGASGGTAGASPGGAAGAATGTAGADGGSSTIDSGTGSAGAPASGGQAGAAG